MRVLHERCCGLDIHKQVVAARLLATGSDGTVQKEVRTYSAMTADLLALSDWLRAEDCGLAVMESTGSHWRPVFNLQVGQREVLVVDAFHAAAVPGRKTDVKDAEWLADLLRHGRHARQLHSLPRPAPPARPHPLSHPPRRRAGPAHQQGVPVKVVSEMLGHASVTITMNLYMHVLPTMQRAAAEPMKALFARGLQSTSQSTGEN